MFGFSFDRRTLYIIIGILVIVSLMSYGTSGIFNLILSATELPPNFKTTVSIFIGTSLLMNTKVNLIINLLSLLYCFEKRDVNDIFLFFSFFEFSTLPSFLLEVLSKNQ